MKKVIKVVTFAVIIPLVVLLGVYVALSWKYKTTYFNGTTINDNYVAGMTAAEVNELLVNQTEMATFSIEDKLGEIIEVPVADMDYSYSYLTELNGILQKQNPLMWGINLVYGTTQSFDIAPERSCDLTQVEAYIREQKLIKNQANPNKIKVEVVYNSKTGYELIDETQNLLDVDKVIEKALDAVSNGEEKINLEEAECYITKEYTAKNKEELSLWKKIDRMQSTEITCQFYDGDEVVDASVIGKWLQKDEKGDPAFDEDGQFIIDEEAVEKTVESWAKKHDTAGGPWKFHPTRGGTVTIEEGTYGYKLNQKKEKEYLIGLVNAKKSESSEAIYSQKGWGNSSGDIGDTYIEVDMTKQHLYYYVKGKLRLDTPVVTGNVNRGNGTPVRVCYIYFKQRNRVLVGPDYRTPVKYWMAVYNHIGIHDANWRNKFGGEIYKSNGSHGCINTPTDKVSQLYDMAEEGTPVILFY